MIHMREPSVRNVHEPLCKWRDAPRSDGDQLIRFQEYRDYRAHIARSLYHADVFANSDARQEALDRYHARFCETCLAGFDAWESTT